MMNKPVRGFLRALAISFLSVAAGLALVYIEMVLIAYFHPAQGEAKALISAFSKAFADGLLPMLRGGKTDLMESACRAAPVCLLAVSAALAWRGGWYQLGAAGHYAVGLAAGACCFSLLSLPWYVCAAVSALAGGLTGAFIGWVKNRFKVHEALVTVLWAWFGVYAAGAALKSFSWQAPYFPELRLAGILITVSAAVLMWLAISFTSFGLAVKVRGESSVIARYAGMNVKKAAMLTFAISGAAAGLAGGLAFVMGLEAEAPGLQMILSGPGLQGLTAAAMANGHVVLSLLTAGAVSHLAQGAAAMDWNVFPPEMGDMALAQILFISVSIMLRHGKKREGRKAE